MRRAVTVALPAPLHARLTVIRADGSASELARRIALALAGDAVDLRPSAGSPVVVTAAAIRQEAANRAAQRFEARTGRRDRAISQRTGIASRRTRLLEQAEWCEANAGPARALLAAVGEVAARVDGARVAAADAATRLARVAQQRAQAQSALEEARLELAGLDGAALDETSVRRELEAATRVEREAAAAVEAAATEVEALRARLDGLETERRELVEAREELGARATSDVDESGEAAVRAALDLYDELAAEAGVDHGARALADAIGRLDAELAELRASIPEPPTDGQVAGAEADLAAARRHVDMARAAAVAFTGPPPPWWDELNALHTGVVEAEAALTGAGFRKGSARRRYDDAVAAERVRLDELGFASHLDALMSGGRLPDERAAAETRIAEAEAAVVEAEAALDRLREALAAGAPITERVAEHERLVAIAVGVLGCDPRDRIVELLSGHPAIPPMVIGDLAVALRGVGVSADGIGVATAARRWLAPRDAARDPQLLARIDRKVAEITAELRTVEASLGPATAIAERAGQAATAAARTVASLEGELQARAGEDGRLVERAGAARALRDQMQAVEARLGVAEGEANDAYRVALDAQHAAEAEHERHAELVGDIARRAARAAEDIDPERRPAFDPLAELGPLGAALRAEAATLGSELEAADIAVAEAEAACTAGPDEPAPADLAEVVRELVAGARPDVPLLLVEPFEGVGDGDVETLLDVLVASLGDHTCVLVTAGLAVAGWAIGLPGDIGALVPARSLDSLLPAGALEAPTQGDAVTVRPSLD